MTARPFWHQFFMNIAHETAKRSTCNRKHVGAVIARDNVQLAGGYNGSMRGDQHCDDVGHLMEGAEEVLELIRDNVGLNPSFEGFLSSKLSHCVRTVHAEQNAIALAAREGVPLKGATMYVTAFPCWRCFMLAVQAGIVRIIYGEVYREKDRASVMERSKYLRHKYCDPDPYHLCWVPPRPVISIHSLDEAEGRGLVKPIEGLTMDPIKLSIVLFSNIRSCMPTSGYRPQVWISGDCYSLVLEWDFGPHLGETFLATGHLLDSNTSLQDLKSPFWLYEGQFVVGQGFKIER